MNREQALQLLRVEIPEAVQTMKDEADGGRWDAVRVQANWLRGKLGEVERIIPAIMEAARPCPTDPAARGSRCVHYRADARCAESWATEPDRRCLHDRKRTCNRHDDCDAADERERAKGGTDREGRPITKTIHCHDSDCEDCFPK